MSNLPGKQAKPQPIVKHRITVVERVYHQLHAGQAESFPSTFTVVTQIDEAPYVLPKGTTNLEGVPIDYGWLNSLPIEMVIIYNLEEAMEKMLKIEFPGSSAFLVVKPGQSARFTPSRNTLDTITLRSMNGSCKYKLIAIPG